MSATLNLLISMRYQFQVVSRLSIAFFECPGVYLAIFCPLFLLFFSVSKSIVWPAPCRQSGAADSTFKTASVAEKKKAINAAVQGYGAKLEKDVQDVEGGELELIQSWGLDSLQQYSSPEGRSWRMLS